MIPPVLLTPEKDPMGKAIAEYFAKGKAVKLRVLSTQFDEDELPVAQLFRPFAAMPELERTALTLAQGRILDVGAGSGCHALALQEMGKDVVAIDISPLSVETMSRRGVLDARHVNLFDPAFTERFDCILMLMNGSGIIGRLENMPAFFQRAKSLLNPGGCIYLDSSDLRYLFDEDETPPTDTYYGQVDFVMQYRNIRGDAFDWLYIDPTTLTQQAAENGFDVEVIQEGEHYDYLARLTPKAE